MLSSGKLSGLLLAVIAASFLALTSCNEQQAPAALAEAEAPPPASPPHVLGEVEIDTSGTEVLREFADPEMRAALLRHLCASPKWRVTDSGFIEAEYQLPRPAGSCRPEVVSPDLLTDKQASVRIEFGRPGVRSRWPRSASAAGAKVAILELTREPGTKHLRSRLGLRNGSGLYVSINEISLDPQRILTQSLLDDLVAELEAVRDGKDVILQKGYLVNELPEASLENSTEEAPLQLIKQKSSETALIRGYVNPGQEGWVVLQIHDATTGREIAFEETSVTREYVGWCDDPAKKFLFESEIRLPPLPQEVRLETWFYPSQGRKLLEQTQNTGG